MKGYRMQYEELLLVQLLLIQQIIRWLTLVTKTESCSTINREQWYQKTENKKERFKDWNRHMTLMRRATRTMLMSTKRIHRCFQQTLIPIDLKA